MSQTRARTGALRRNQYPCLDKDYDFLYSGDYYDFLMIELNGSVIELNGFMIDIFEFFVYARQARQGISS